MELPFDAAEKPTEKIARWGRMDMKEAARVKRAQQWYQKYTGDARELTAQKKIAWLKKYAPTSVVAATTCLQLFIKEVKPTVFKVAAKHSLVIWYDGTSCIYRDGYRVDLKVKSIERATYGDDVTEALREMARVCEVVRVTRKERLARAAGHVHTCDECKTRQDCSEVDGRWLCYPCS
jgi:hypothetical protein